MLKALFLSILIYLSLTGWSQPVINERYSLGADAVIFRNIIATDSCYYVSGMQSYNQGNAVQEGLFVKYDLDGNPVEVSNYRNDTLEYIFWESQTLIETVDGNFAQSFFIVPTNNGDPFYLGFAKLKPNGDTLLFRTYFDIYNENLDDWCLSPGGFLQDPLDSCYYGTVNIDRDSDGVSGVALFKLDQYGNFLWHQKYYGDNSNYQHYTTESLIKTGPNRLVLGGTRVKYGAFDSQTRYNVKILETDTLGNIIQTNIFTNDILGGGCNGLTKTNDGGYLYSGGEGYFIQNGDAIRSQGRVVKLDANFNEEWKIIEGLPTGSSYVGLLNVTPISDSTFVTVGLATDRFGQPISNNAGWLLKFDIDGNIKWQRLYQKVVANSNTNNFPTHILYDVDVTTDGGFVMVGQSQNFEIAGHPLGQMGWIVKADKYGCLVPNCQQYDGLNISEVDKTSFGLDVFPNPSSHEVFIYYANTNHQGSVTKAGLYNSSGQAVLNFEMPSNNTTYMLDVSSLASGVYLLKVVSHNTQRTEKIVIK